MTSSSSDSDPDSSDTEESTSRAALRAAFGGALPAAFVLTTASRSASLALPAAGALALDGLDGGGGARSAATSIASDSDPDCASGGSTSRAAFGGALPDAFESVCTASPASSSDVSPISEINSELTSLRPFRVSDPSVSSAFSSLMPHGFRLPSVRPYDFITALTVLSFCTTTGRGAATFLKWP